MPRASAGGRGRAPRGRNLAQRDPIAPCALANAKSPATPARGGATNAPRTLFPRLGARRTALAGGPRG
eukprot:8001475-Lingulodinium_polyedra.AAC.1